MTLSNITRGGTIEVMHLNPEDPKGNEAPHFWYPKGSDIPDSWGPKNK